jgi:hypothetical protein
MEVITHDKVIFKNLPISTRIPTNSTLVDEIVDAISKFDIEKISDLIPEDAEYEGYSNKYGFLAEYKALFDDSLAYYDRLHLPLLAIDANCNSCALNEVCTNDKLIYCFIDYTDDTRVFTMVFETDKQGTLVEMYRCYNNLPTFQGLLNAKKKKMNLI